MKSLKRPTFAILALVLVGLPVAHAEQPAPSAEASVAQVPSASAAAIPLGMSVSAYAWPKEASDPPKEEEWAGATALETITTVSSTGWIKKKVDCRPRAIRAWVRIDCWPPDNSSMEILDGQRFYGSLWGLAGDISGASGQFQLVSSAPRYAKAMRPDPSDIPSKFVRNMGATGTVVFQAKYGSAAMLRLDQIFWAEQYDGGGNVLLEPGIVIDVSWALGEKYPTIELHG